jgi:cardiolipin synthase
MNVIEIFFIAAGVCGLGFWILSVFTPLGRGSATFSVTEPITFFDKNFITALEGVSRATFEHGGLPKILNNGDEFFPALLADIAAAKHTIHIAVFILRPEEPIGKEVLNALMRKSKEGIKVRLLLDSRGSKKVTKKVQKELEHAGIKVVMFRPLKFGILTQYDKRNHCRAFIIDGKVGYTGGMAIGQEWTGHAQDTKHWRDMMFKATGRQAHAIQRVFATLWMNACGEVIAGESAYPNIKQESTDLKWLSITSSPALETNLIANVYWLSCMAARKGIYLQNSYFVPNKHMRQALTQKAQEGVEVILMLPNTNNNEKMVYHAGRFFYDELLSAGVKIYEFQPTMIHTKSFLADDVWSIIGSANMDVRSQELNEENILCILSETFGRQQRKYFDADLEKCKEITIDVWRKRSFYSRFLECVCVLMGHQL